MGCMPYGQNDADNLGITESVSIPHMGCMPYGPSNLTGDADIVRRFNPSYGLHALRARTTAGQTPWPARVSIPHMGCMPYGRLRKLSSRNNCVVSIPHMGCMPYGQIVQIHCCQREQFQSLIWVACPTGREMTSSFLLKWEFQSLIWVACPTGRAATRATSWSRMVSIPHMGCMPYGRQTASSR